MADNFTVIDGGQSSRTLATADHGGVHHPTHIMEGIDPAGIPERIGSLGGRLSVNNALELGQALSFDTSAVSNSQQLPAGVKFIRINATSSYRTTNPAVTSQVVGTTAPPIPSAL